MVTACVSEPIWWKTYQNSCRWHRCTTLLYQSLVLLPLVLTIASVVDYLDVACCRKCLHLPHTTFRKHTSPSNANTIHVHRATTQPSVGTSHSCLPRPGSLLRETSSWPRRIHLIRVSAHFRNTRKARLRGQVVKTPDCGLGRTGFDSRCMGVTD